MTSPGHRAALAALLLALTAGPALATGPRLTIAWQPEQPRVGDVAWLLVRDLPDGATIEGTVGDEPVSFFTWPGGRAAMVGFDLESAGGSRPWEVRVIGPTQEHDTLRGEVWVAPRSFPVQRLTLPATMVHLDPATERRAVAEAEILGATFRTVTPGRLWQGPFVRPLPGTERGTGFGARRVINDQPRMPHGGSDYAAPRGTPVVAANDGRVALTGDFFFPGRLVVLDHGMGVYTLYFHLDQVTVEPGARVGRGQRLGTVGATGRATGPHLHFGAHVNGARVDPEVLLDLPGID